MKVAGKDDRLQKIEWLKFKGLNIQADTLSRPFDTWRRLENVDMFIPGSMRKIVGPAVQSGPYPNPIVEMITYRRTATSPQGILLIDSTGGILNLGPPVTAQIASFGPVGQPFVFLFPGIYNSNQILYLISTVTGGPPKKYDGLGNITAVGVSEPATGVSLTLTTTATNANAYLMQIGVQYLWTYWNPTTLHESSPSPVPSTAIITPTTNNPPLATPYISQVRVDLPTVAPSIGDGYTRIRLYRTQDGGRTFFLIPKAYNAAGVNLNDTNYSFLIQGASSTVYDGVVASSIAPTPDQLMVTPAGGAPTIGSHNPPPDAVWGAVYQGRAWYVDPDLKRIWFSEIEDFQSVGTFSYMNFAKDILDEITAVEPLSDRMIVFGKNTARQITGTDFSDFVEVPIDMSRGCVGRRAATSDGDNIYTFTEQGLARLAFAPSGPPFIGDIIKPLTDLVLSSSFQSIINMDIDIQRGILWFAIKINGVTYNDQFILIDLSEESPFSTVVGLPTEVITVRSLELANGSNDLYFAGADNYIYQMYTPAPYGGSLVATMETQQLPLTDLTMWKVYQDILCQGLGIEGWKMSYSVDGGTTFINQKGVNRRTRIGIGGLEIILRFVHNTNVGFAPLLSRATLEYEVKMGGL